MSKNFNNEVMLGGFIVVAGGLLAYMSVAVGGFNMAQGVHVKASFSNASGLVKDAAVTIAGVQVGHIEGMEVAHDKAIVKIFLRKDAHVRQDVKLAIRAKSLLGEKYLELTPQSLEASLLADGAMITDTRAAVEVDELLAAMAPLIKEVDPKDVATIVRTVAKTLKDEQGSLAAVIHNAAQVSDQVNQLIAANRQNVDKIAANMASLSQDGNALMKAKRPELERSIARIDHITGVIDNNAPELTRRAQNIARNVDSIAATVNAQAPGLSRDLGRVMKNADSVMVRLPGTLDDLSGLRKDATYTLGKVNPLLDRASAFDSAKMREMAQEILIKNGIKVYMHPFGPVDVDWQKQPSPSAQSKP